MHPSLADPAPAAADPERLVTVGDLRLLVRRDRERGWDAFARRYYPRLLGYGWRLTENMDEAEDLVQQVMTRWYRIFTGESQPGVSHPLADERPIFPWLARALRNLWIDAWRRHEGAEPVERDPEGEAPEGEASEGEVRRVVFRLDQRECLKQRPASDRELLLQAAEGLSVRDLERVTGIPRGNVSRRLLQVKEAVKRCLERHGWTEAEVRRELCHG